VARRSTGGFTLVELLVVIAIIGILIGLLLPAVQAAREAARRTTCVNNIKQIGVALHVYHGPHNTFPPGGLSCNGLGFLVMLLPYMEQKPLYERFDFSAGEYHHESTDPNAEKFKVKNSLNRIDTFLCPSCTEEKSNLGNNLEKYPHNSNGQNSYTTHYVGIMGPRGALNPATGKPYEWDYEAQQWGPICNQGVLYRNSRVRIGDISDGTSTTFAVGEISWHGYRKFRTWVRGATLNQYCTITKKTQPGMAQGSTKNVYAPIGVGGNGYNKFNDGEFGSEHPRGTNFMRADGSVRFIFEDIDHTTYLALASRNGNEVEAKDEVD